MEELTLGIVPFQLRVLGTVTVRAETDALLSSRITQPRHLALLCYLALARPRGLHSRDTIIALLWPEHDIARGRRALRNALYTVRQSLGADALVTVGENLVGLNPSIVSCDATDLEQNLLNASATNGAEPLQGLHVTDSVEFDQWMAVERMRLLGLLNKPQREREGLSAAITPVARSTTRNPHSLDVSTMYLRGHYLFLRSAHGGTTEDLLQSREYFERAHAMDSGYALALAGLSNFYAVAARRSVITPFHETFARAIEYSERTLAMDDSLAVPHVHFGVQALYLRDAFDRAGREFELAVAKEPGYAEARRFYGVWLGMAGRRDDALNEMEEAVRLEPDIPQMLSSLAAARQSAGDTAGCEEVLRTAIRIDPGHAPVRDRLICLLEECGRIQDALAERLLRFGAEASRDFQEAFEQDGVDGYQRVLTAKLRNDAARIEERLMQMSAPTVDEIFAPPVVRLVSIYGRLRDWKRVRSWRLQGTAGRPGLARWFEHLPELTAMPSESG